MTLHFLPVQRMMDKELLGWFNRVNPEIICAFLTQEQLLSYPIELKFSSVLVSDFGPLLDCTSREIFYVGNSKSSPSVTQ